MRWDGLGRCAVAQPACGGGLFALLACRDWCGPRESWQKKKKTGARVLATFSCKYMRHVVCSCVYILRVFQSCPHCAPWSCMPSLEFVFSCRRIHNYAEPFACAFFPCRAEPFACACWECLNMSVLLSRCIHLPQVGAGVRAESPVIARSTVCSRFHGRVRLCTLLYIKIWLKTSNNNAYI